MISFLIKKFTSIDSDEAQKRKICGFVCGLAGVFFNLILFFAKFFIGFISSSIAITAEAFNNLSDAGTSIVSLAGFIWSGRKADSEHPFGHGRIEYLSGIIISFVIILVGFELLKSSAEKIFTPQKPEFNTAVFIVLILSIAVKLYMALYNSRYGKKISSETLKAAAADSLSDTVSTATVLIASVFMSITDIYIDGYVGAVVSIFIIWTGVKSVISTASPLLGNAPDSEFVSKVEKIVFENPETVGIHDMVVHSYGPNKKFVSLHMEVDGSHDLFLVHDAVDLTERRIAQELGCEAIIHMDPLDIANPELKEIYSKISKRAQMLGEGIEIHDLRIVPGPTHTNVIFDVVLPPPLYKRKNDFEAELEKTVKELNDNYFAVIKSEMSYCGGK